MKRRRTGQVGFVFGRKNMDVVYWSEKMQSIYSLCLLLLAVAFRCALRQRQKDRNLCLTGLLGSAVSRNASRISQHRPSQGSLVGRNGLR